MIRMTATLALPSLRMDFIPSGGDIQACRKKRSKIGPIEKNSSVQSRS